MAPALTSNSFRVTAGSYPDPNTKPRKPRAVVVRAAKQNPFSLRNESPPADGTSNGSVPFFFDLSKIADAKSLIPLPSSPSTSLFANLRRKDPNAVFVAGASGQAGIRIAQTLLRRGFAVRAGVPDLAAAQELARLAATYKIISPEESKRLNAVESGFSDAETVAKAIGPAAKVVVTVGSGENGPAGNVTTVDALTVVRAAKLAGVGHVAVVWGSGGSVTVSTYNVLDGITSFFSGLFARSQQLTLSEFMSEVAEIDIGYTVIKAALTEDYSPECSHGVVVSKEGTAAAAGISNDSKVTKSQIAALVADVFANTSLAENKVVEVSTSQSASSKPIVEVFSAIPEDGRRKAYAEALAKAKAEEEAVIASEKAKEAAEVSKKLEVEVKKLSELKARATNLADEARERAEAAGASLESLVGQAKDLSGVFSWGTLTSQIATAVNTASQKSGDGPRTQVATVRGQAKARALPPKKAVVKQPQPKTRSKEPEQKPEVNKIFGGLFKQETIYMED